MPASKQNASELFGEEYFRTGCGLPYERSAHWLNFFGGLADEIIRSLKPRTVLDAGCALGLLVESFWDRGVEAYGFDVSSFAISQVRRDIEPYCWQASITEPIQGRYDLVTCIEVLEHLQPDETEAAIASLAAASDTILFSSTPTDLSEATHFNVRPTIGWLNLFKEVGFWPDCTFSASFVAPHAMLLRKQLPLPEDTLLLFSEGIRWRLAYNLRDSQNAALSQQLTEARSGLVELQGAQDEAITARSGLLELQGARDHLLQEKEELERKLAHLAREKEREFAEAITARSGLLELQQARNHLLQEKEELERKLAHLTREREREFAEAITARSGLLELQGARDHWLQEKEALERKYSGLRADLREAQRTSSSLTIHHDKLQATIHKLQERLRRGEAQRRADVARAHLQAEYLSLRTALSKTARRLKLRMKSGRAAIRTRRLGLLRQIDLVAKSSLFDPQWYLRANRDVATSGLNPLVHFVTYGGSEGRSPGPDFDAKWYKKRYPDVAAGNVSPLIHYLEVGKAEGRESRPVGGDGNAKAPGSTKRQSRLKQRIRSDRAPLRTRPVQRREARPVGGKPGGPGNAEARASMKTELLDPETNRRVELVLKSSFFDRAWYLETYPELATAGVDPAVHFVTNGGVEGRSPSRRFDAKWYLENHPDVANAKLNPLVHYLEYGRAENRAMRHVIEGTAADQLLRDNFIDSMPALTYSSPRSSRRVTVVTNGIETARLFGGVATALILATLLAKKMDAALRIVTRRASPVPGNFAQILAANGITWQTDVEFLHAPVDDTRPISVSDCDLFLTTSWWTTKSMREAVDPSRVIYLLQEDERMFYPFGDERLRCESTIMDPSIRYIVNSELLFRHLTAGSDACSSVAQGGMWFEPAFPSRLYFPEQRNLSDGKRQFFFYARPDNHRNLFWRGLEAIAAALEGGQLLPHQWEFNFVGSDHFRIVLPGNPTVRTHANLQWSEYAALVRQMHLGLCLMDTPHPSYPPLDLAASGAVVVTNRRGFKTSLEHYSPNILCAESSVGDLAATLGTAVRLLEDEEARTANYSRNQLLRDWAVALDPVTAWISQSADAEGR